MKVSFLVNSGSRSGEEAFHSAHSALQVENLDVVSAACFDEVADFLQAIRNEIADPEVEVIVIGGGDGTQSLAVDLISQSDKVLGVMPLGTGNQFAKDLGISTSFPEAAKVIAQGRVCKSDIAEVNGNRFVNVATIGVTTDIANNLSFKKQLGKFAYLPAAFQAMADLKPFRVRIDHGSEWVERDVIQVVVCNGRLHAGPFVASPEATLADGVLDCYTIEETNLWESAKIGAMALTGQHVDLDPVHLVRASKITIKTEPKKPVTLDGETVWHDEMVFTCLPAALNVCVPESFRAPSERIYRLNSSLTIAQE